MVDENEVEEDQGSPLDVVEDEPAEVSAEPESEPTQAVPAQPSMEDEVELNIGGQVEKLTRAEYEYLARMGAQSLYEQRTEDQTPTPPSPQDEGRNIYANPQEDAMNPKMQDMENQLHDMQAQLHQSQVEAESQKIQNYVEDRLYQSEIFNAVSQLPEAENLLTEVRKEIYNKTAQEGLSPEDSVNSIESKYSSLLGGDRKNYLMKKLRASAEAVPGVGGNTKSPGKPLDAKDWASGKLLDSITEKLNSSGM